MRNDNFGSFLSSLDAPDFCVGTFEGELAAELKDVHFGYNEGREVRNRYRYRCLLPLLLCLC